MATRRTPLSVPCKISVTAREKARLPPQSQSHRPLRPRRPLSSLLRTKPTCKMISPSPAQFHRKPIHRQLAALRPTRPPPATPQRSKRHWHLPIRLLQARLFAIQRPPATWPPPHLQRFPQVLTSRPPTLRRPASPGHPSFRWTHPRSKSWKSIFRPVTTLPFSTCPASGFWKRPLPRCTSSVPCACPLLTQRGPSIARRKWLSAG